MSEEEKWNVVKEGTHEEAMVVLSFASDQNEWDGKRWDFAV